MNPLVQVFMAFQAVILAVIDLMKSVVDLTFGNIFGNQLNSKAIEASTDEQCEAGGKDDAQVDGTDIDNPGEDYIKTSAEPKEPEPEGSSDDFNNEDEDEDSSSDDDTVVNAADSEEEIFEDSRSDNTFFNEEKQGQAGVDEQQEFDVSGDEGTYLDSIEEIEPGQEHPVQSRDEPTQRSEVDVLQKSIVSIDEGEAHLDEKAEISQEDVKAYVQNVIASAHEIVADETEIENVFHSDQYPSFPVEGDGINDKAADNPPDVSKTVFGDLDADNMGEGASKLEPQNLSEHPLIPADISDLTAGEAKGPTGDKIIIIDYKKRRQDQEATENPSSLEADEETYDINGRQNDSLASDPCEALKYDSRDSVDDEDNSTAQMQEQPFSLEKSPESGRREEETEIVFDGSLASHPNDLPVDEDQDPLSFTVGDISADNELETQNIGRSSRYPPHSGSTADTAVQSSSYEGEGDELTPVVTENDRTARFKDEASADWEDNLHDERRLADNEIQSVVEDIARQEIQQTEESEVADNLIGLSHVGRDNEPNVPVGNVLNDSNDMSEDEDNQNEESKKELEALGGELPLISTCVDVVEDDSFAKLEDDAQEEEEMKGLPADVITDDGDYMSRDEIVEQEGEFDKVEGKTDLPISASCQQLSFAENRDTDRKIFNDETDFHTDNLVEVEGIKSVDDTTEDDKILVLDNGDDNNMAEPIRKYSDDRSTKDPLEEENENEKEDEKGDLPIFTSGDETLTGNLESEKESDDMSEDDDNQSEEHRNELEVLDREILLTNTDVDVAEDDSLAKLEDYAQEEEHMEGSPAEVTRDGDDYRSTDESVGKEGDFDKVEEEIDLPLSASCEQSSFAENLDTDRKIVNDGTEFRTENLEEVVDIKSDHDTTEDDKIVVLDTGDGDNMTELTRNDSDDRSANDALEKGGEREKKDENEDFKLEDIVQEEEGMDGSPAEVTKDGDEYRPMDESVGKEGKFDKVEEEIDLPLPAPYEQASFPGNCDFGAEIVNDENDIQNENLLEVLDMKPEDDSTEEGGILVLDSGNDNSMTEAIRDESEQRSATDALGKEDETEKADAREDLRIVTLGDETSTENMKPISHDAPDDEISDKSNDLDSVGSHEGVEERVATPASVTEDESAEKDDSVRFPLDVSEGGTPYYEMGLCEAIEVNNLYLSKPNNYPEAKYEEFPVTKISRELETNEDEDDNEAGDAAYESVERSDDDSIVSDHIASDVEDAIESEKLAKDLEEKRIEEMSRRNPEQGQSMEELISNEDNANENDDEWESTGSASTSTTPSIDYREDEEDQDVSEVDENKLESKPYGENDIDDKFIEEAVTFQANVSLESSDFKNLLNQLNGGSYENSDGSAPRRTYTDEEVKQAIQILTSRPPYDTKDVDYENFYKGMSRAETLRVFALVLAPNQQEKKERVFAIFANSEDVSCDNRYIGDEEKIAPSVADNNVDLSGIVASLEQHILVDRSEDVETCPDFQADDSRILDSQKHESEDDETESSSSASSGMYFVDDYSGILDEERSQIVLVDENESIPVSELDDEYQESDVSLHGGKFFCVTRRFAKSFDDIDLIDKVVSENAPIQTFSDVPPNVGRPLPTHKTPLDWIDPEESKDVKIPLEKDSHQPSQGELSVDTETRILHLSDDRVEYDTYLYHQPTEHDVGNADQGDGVLYNAYHDHDSREGFQPSELEDAIIPTTHETKPYFRPQDLGDGEWEKVDSPRKLQDVKEFEFNPVEVKHITFEENVLPIDHDRTGVHEYDIVPEVFEPIESSQIMFDFDEAPETHDITDPTILVTTINAPENNNGPGKQEVLDGTTDTFIASEDGQESTFEEGNPPLQEDAANYNVYLEHDSIVGTGDGPESNVEDAIVPTTHDTKLVFQPQDMGDGDWEKVDNSGGINDGKNFDFYPPEVKHRSFEENILPIDHDIGTVHENDIVPDVLEPSESVRINFDFDEPPETHAISEPPILVTTIKLKSQENNYLTDKSQLLDEITDIIDDDVFEEIEETESIESNPPHFHDEYEPLPENLHASKDQKDERQSSTADVLRDVGITDDDDGLGGSAFVVVGTPSEHVTRDNIKVSEMEVDETLPLQSDNLIAGQEKTAKVDCDDTLHGNNHRSSSSSSSSSAFDANDSSEKEEFPYESLNNDIDSFNKEDNENDTVYIPSLAFSSQHFSSSSSSYEDDDHVDVGLNHSDRTDSGRRSSSSSSSSSNNTAQEPEVPERVDTDQAPEKHGFLADNYYLTSEEAAEQYSFNSSTDGPTDVTVISIDKENDGLDNISDDIQVQALLSGDLIGEDEDHGINEGSDETYNNNNDRHNPIAETTDVTMEVYLERVPSVDETLRSTDTPHDCKPEEDNSFQIPTKTPDNDVETRPTVEDTVSPVSFSMYLDTAPLNESPVEIDTYLEHVPKLESGREADVGVIFTSDSDDVTPPRGRVESSSPASAFSDSDVGEEPASGQPSIIFAVYGKVSETDKPDEKPMVVAIHQSQKSLSSHNLQEGDERSYEFQGRVEVFREEDLGEIHKRSVTSFVEISTSSRQPVDQMNVVPDLDIIHDDHVK